MSLRTKLIGALGLLGVLATVLIGLLSYRATTSELRASIDRSLDEVAVRLPGVDGELDRDRVTRRDRSLERVLVQRITPSGGVLSGPRSGDLPVDAVDLAVAGGSIDRVRRNVVIDGEPHRLLTIETAGGAVQLARSQAEVEQVSAVLRRRTVLLAAVVGLAACVLGWLLATQLTRRLTALTAAASEVAATGRLDSTVTAVGTDETAQLAAAFNSMLATLAASKTEQQRLVQDAGHELRTPLTSLRTNVSVLQRYDALSSDQRAQVLADIDSESRELSTLVNELVQLATESRADEAVQSVRLAGIVEGAVDRVRRRTGREVTVIADDSVAVVRPQALDRAVHNIVDNAAKFAPTGPIEVSVHAGTVSVADRGPGVSAAEAERLFDRFYRTDATRAMPGSGLGLSIVKEIVVRHGGAVFAGPRDGGGAVIGFRVPVVGAE
jgi:two-component system sensor histidine kinase MprB